MGPGLKEIRTRLDALNSKYKRKRDCTISGAKTIVLICFFVFPKAKTRFFLGFAHFILQFMDRTVLQISVFERVYLSDQGFYSLHVLNELCQSHRQLNANCRHLYLVCFLFVFFFFFFFLFCFFIPCHFKKCGVLCYTLRKKFAFECRSIRPSISALFPCSMTNFLQTLYSSGRSGLRLKMGKFRQISTELWPLIYFKISFLCSIWSN